MDNKEAIESMKNIIEHWSYRPNEVKAATLAIEALEKQIPKAVIRRKLNHMTCNCPVCNRIYWERGDVGNYCISCGHRLKVE